MRSDSEIQKDVMDELRWEPMLNAAEIGVAVRDGVVTLSGTVRNYLTKLQAEKAAQRVRDVKAVAMDIEVALQTEHQYSDTEIAEAAVSTLKWNTAVPDDMISLKVDNGWVTLTGKVRWQYQKVAAAKAIQALAGVKGVKNLIALLPAVNAAVVKDNIRMALERNADVEASRVRIDADGSKVTLSGYVNSWNERRIVENAAWSSPGVTIVEDDLMISD